MSNIFNTEFPILILLFWVFIKPSPLCGEDPPLCESWWKQEPDTLTPGSWAMTHDLVSVKDFCILNK